MKGKRLKAKGELPAKELTEREKAMHLYGKDAVETIERGEEDIKAGRVTRIGDVKNIWENIL